MRARLGSPGVVLGLFAGLVGGLAGGCYDPDFSQVHYRCDGQSPTCPDGLRCVRGQCVDPKEGLGCLSGQGRRVGDNIYACPGLFSRGRAAADLCAPGFTICEDGNGVDARACGPQDRRGFFASRAQARRAPLRPPGEVVCGSPATGEALLLLGCGAQEADTMPAPGCGLPLALDCDSTRRITCGTSIDDAANQEDAESGVLCCVRVD